MDHHTKDAGAEPCRKSDAQSYCRNRRARAPEPERATRTEKHGKCGLESRVTGRGRAIENGARRVERMWRIVLSHIKC